MFHDNSYQMAARPRFCFFTLSSKTLVPIRDSNDDRHRHGSSALAHPLCEPRHPARVATYIAMPIADLDQPAGAALGDAVIGDQLLRRSVSLGRPGQFFPANLSAPTRRASTPLSAFLTVGYRPPASATAASDMVISHTSPSKCRMSCPRSHASGTARRSSCQRHSGTAGQ